MATGGYPSKPEVERGQLHPDWPCWRFFPARAGIVDVSVRPVPEESRIFRLFTVLAAMVVLGAFVFLRQYLQDRHSCAFWTNRGAAMRTRSGCRVTWSEGKARLPGPFGGWAAHEIDHADGYHDVFRATLVESTVDRRARRPGAQDCKPGEANAGLGPSDLLSFAQESPAEKTLVDVPCCCR